MVFGCLPHRGTCPGEVDQGIGTPPVTEALGRVERPQPPNRDQVLASRLDAAQVHAEDLCNPGGFTPAAAAAALLAVVETADQVPQHGGDDGGFETARDEAHGLARHGHATAVVGDGVVHRAEAGEILDSPQVCGDGGKGECGARPGQQAEGFETAEGGPQVLTPSPTDEPMEFLGSICGDVVRCELTPPDHHFLGGKPDPQVHELDASGAVGPPEQTELLDGKKKKSPNRLARLHFRICSCHVASLWVYADETWASAFPMRAAFGDTHLP